MTPTDSCWTNWARHRECIRQEFICTWFKNRQSQSVMIQVRMGWRESSGVLEYSVLDVGSSYMRTYICTNSQYLCNLIHKTYTLIKSKKNKTKQKTKNWVPRKSMIRNHWIASFGTGGCRACLVLVLHWCPPAWVPLGGWLSRIFVDCKHCAACGELGMSRQPHPTETTHL